ncbi:MAG TPA: amidohydrolase family protein [Chloroflexia bacterium]|jgi:carbamoyl-phosphate synthase/aspartate carbamoyltransferase/dihydroorotase
MSTIRLPGLIDPHVHLRDPGATHKEDFTTGTQAALAGGFTMLLDMPNNYGNPVVSPEALSGKIAATQDRLFCDVGFFYGAGPANTDTYTEVAADVAGLKLYLNHTTGDLKIEGVETIRAIMLAWPRHKPLCVHAEGSTLAMVLDLLPAVRRSVHVCHVSLAEEIAMIREARERGLPVTCEVAPHHLCLTEDDVPRLGGFGIMKPPLGTAADVDALWRNLEVVDMIATDHAPHTLKEKESDDPPFGVPGLETSLPLMLTAVHAGRLTLDRLVEMMHHAPKRIFSLPEQSDSYIEIDSERQWRFTSDNLYTKCGWTPFEGMSVVGAVEGVWLRGRQVVREGRVITAAPGGRFTRPVA